ncbi:type 1 glutamine amidotransferase-like domain-containing protein [Exiguobacterium sp. Helios]|uniref:Type 1 glutamine amidotransferase-like domain-containing protein n=1 Tax=Exiguobacterium sp. Helios TaxID=2735868 RepID=UPI00165DA040|nr:Type 1 glutamine amidotransferase-like domain-containing protein [Exiguobacterium sp. Helios]QNR19953.1 type 1 glutamine amidotransferase-like domain-containing protein [Exiguobacterium sp. Helios]
MMDQQLFLFGGGPPFTSMLCQQFVSCLDQSGPVALLYVPRPGSNWDDYAPIYTDALTANGATDFFHFPLSARPTPEQLEQLAGSAGIIISGGETERYQQFIVGTPIGTLIQERFQHGVPVAGFSAGALLTPNECRIPAIDQRNGQALVLKGLGLLADAVISVHYDTWQEETNLSEAFMTTASNFGYGLPERSGVYLKNGRLMQQEGPEAVLLGQKGENI